MRGWVGKESLDGYAGAVEGEGVEGVGSNDIDGAHLPNLTCVSLCEQMAEPVGSRSGGMWLVVDAASHQSIPLLEHAGCSDDVVRKKGSRSWKEEAGTGTAPIGVSERDRASSIAS